MVKNAKDATCTEPGYTGDKVCTVCGETVEYRRGHPRRRPLQGWGVLPCGAADPNANSGGNTGNNGTDSPNTADEAAMGLWLSLMTVAASGRSRSGSRQGTGRFPFAALLLGDKALGGTALAA